MCASNQILSTRYPSRQEKRAAAITYTYTYIRIPSHDRSIVGLPGEGLEEVGVSDGHHPAIHGRDVEHAPGTKKLGDRCLGFPFVMPDGGIGEVLLLLLILLSNAGITASTYRVLFRRWLAGCAGGI